MQSRLIAWNLLWLATMFVFPQLLGILLYFRLSRAPRWVPAIAASLAPAVIFFWLARISLLADLREVYARGVPCGMPALAAAFFLLAGTTVHLVAGPITQVALAASRRRKSRSV